MKKLSVVIPTFNEAENVRKLYHKLDIALAKYSWEAIYVDDQSTDSTLEEVEKLSSEFNNIRLIRRFGRRGLSSACIEGMLSSTSEFVAVIDADLQHDETILPKMIEKLEQKQSLQLVVGSRYCKGASLGTLEDSRRNVSKIATKFSRLFYKAELTDPMSGFFMLKTDFFVSLAPKLSGLGYKILLDIVMTEKNIEICEIPYDMRSRESGESKLDVKVTYEYFLLILDKTVGQYIPTRLIMFLMVGATGVVLQLLFVWLFYLVVNLSYLYATISATYMAMTSNFILNNQFTYKDKKLKGAKLFSGYISFVIACSMGAVINVNVATISFENLDVWWLASLLGAIFGSVWNYTMANIITWKVR